MVILLDFDGTLFNQNRKLAYAALVQQFAVGGPRNLADRLLKTDLKLCAKELYDRRYVFCEFLVYFPGCSRQRLARAFWREVTKRQVPLVKNLGHILQSLSTTNRLVIATDSDGPDGNKRARVQKAIKGLGMKRMRICIGSEGRLPEKGSPRFVERILKTLSLENQKHNCVFVGDKLKSDLLPAQAAGISSILVANREYDPRGKINWPIKIKSVSDLAASIEGLSRTVFISHSHDDAKRVERIEKSLCRRGIKVRRDKEIKIGENLSLRLEEIIRACPFFLLVLSKRSIRSEWVRREVARVTGEGSVKQILPVIIDETLARELPMEVQGQRYIRLTNNNFGNAICELEDAILARDMTTACRRRR